MSMAYQRGIVLYNQGRFDLAAQEMRQELAESPENGFAHGFLAICLFNTGDKEQALREADEAVRLEPAAAFCHYVRGQVLCRLGNLKEAETSAREAIRLEPADADYRALMASVEMARRRWAAALQAAETGLALDPEHQTCTNLRAMALVQLGRKDEAAQALGSALANEPEDALTHANQGWALLHQGDHRRALEHFREALRLNPELEWARVGIIEALKARHLLYRVMLRFMLWLGRQSRVAQWAVILGFIFGRKALDDLARARPALAPFIEPLLFLTFAFLILTWIASPLFNLLLRFNRFGRLALSPQERVASSWIGGCFILAAGFFVAKMITGSIRADIAMSYFGFLLMPMAMMFSPGGRGRPHKLLVTYAVVVALLGLPLLSAALLDNYSPWRNLETAGGLFRYFLYGCIFATWIPALLRSRLGD